MMLPLRSTSITEVSALLRAAPSLYPALVLRRLWGFHLRFSLNIGMTGSHVPHKSLNQVHATFVPAAARPVNRFPPNLSRANDYLPVLTTSIRFRHFISGSLTFVSLALT